MNTVEIIDRKRQGEELSRGDIESIVLGYVRGTIPDYQVAAWLMAICCRGMTRRETLDLTSVMVESGTTLDVSHTPWPVADKHSSGGVGDKTTLVVAPLVRACGVAVGKMSGRGLGFTGGTLDKLESIPGFRVELSAAEFIAQLEKEGIVVAGQTADIAPADKKLYALRDVTGTVESLPLIASSIMSKKLAVGAQAVVLDVKAGSGAFMAGADDARDLARLMVEIGTGSGKKVSALLSPMGQPLGNAVGNAVEVEEAIRTLRGQGPADLVELAVRLSGEMLFLAGRAESPAAGAVVASGALASGAALDQFRRLVELQGGDPQVVDRPEIMGRAPVVLPVVAPSSGWVTGADARRIAGVALRLGAGRVRKENSIDPLVGVLLHAKVGSEVRAGDLLAEIFASSTTAAEAAARELLDAYHIGTAQPRPEAVILDRIGEWNHGASVPIDQSI